MTIKILLKALINFHFKTNFLFSFPDVIHANKCFFSAHFVLTHPTENNIVFLADLGSDNVVCYLLKKNPETGTQLILHCNCQLPYGTGPRTMSWDKDGERIYVSGELNNTVSVILFKEGNTVLFIK